MLAIIPDYVAACSAVLIDRLVPVDGSAMTRQHRWLTKTTEISRRNPTWIHVQMAAAMMVWRQSVPDCNRATLGGNLPARVND